MSSSAIMNAGAVTEIKRMGFIQCLVSVELIPSLDFAGHPNMWDGVVVASAGHQHGRTHFVAVAKL